MRTLPFVFCLMLLAVSPISCSLVQKEKVDLIIKAGSLFDAQRGGVFKNKIVIVDGGRVKSIEDFDNDLNRYSAHQQIDASDKFVMPALFDTHSHVTFFVDTITTKGGSPSIDIYADEELSKWHLRMMLYQGITNTRELGSFPEISVNLRAQERAGKIQSPRILACSEPMSEQPLIFPAVVKEIKSVEEARAYVKKMKVLEVDYVKLLFNLSAEHSRAAIEEAHRLGLKVAGHINTTSWSEAIDMKIDALVHIPYGNEPMMDLSSDHVSEVLRRMAEEGIPNDPTLAMRYGYFENTNFGRNTQLPEVYDSAPPRLKEMWRMLSEYKEKLFKPNPEMAQYHYNYVRKAYEAGVLLSTSSDTWTSWTDYGNTIHNEMYLLSKAGIPNEDVLIMATKNGAYQLDMQNDYGTIEVGKVADILILTENPLADIKNTRTIDAVIKGGKVIDRKNLLY